MQAEKHFKPEFLNRLSEIVVFEPLSQDKMRVVANVQMKAIIARLAEKGINIIASEAVLDVVLSESHNPVSMISPFTLTFFACAGTVFFTWNYVAIETSIFFTA